MNSGTVFDVQHGSFIDGPGIRTVIFLKGCNLDCQWCHNPESKSRRVQLLFYQERCTGCGKCREVCPNTNEKCSLCGACVKHCPSGARKLCGETWSVEEVMKEVRKDEIFYMTSGGGVTFSGGECMLQIDFLLEALQACKSAGIETAVDTAGNVPWESFEKILPWTDVFLYDVKCFSPEKHKKYTGADNRLILDNLKRIFAAGKRVWIRIPVMAGVNDSPEEMQAIRDFLMEGGKPENIELLPYHAMGIPKAKAAGLTPVLFEPPGAERMDELKRIFQLKIGKEGAEDEETGYRSRQCGI